MKKELEKKTKYEKPVLVKQGKVTDMTASMSTPPPP